VVRQRRAGFARLNLEFPEALHNTIDRVVAEVQVLIACGAAGKAVQQ